MATILTVVLCLVALLTLGTGLAALTGGWVLPWLAPQVRRPRLYGIGQLLFGVFTVLLTTSRYEWPRALPMPLIILGTLCAFAGAITSFIAQRRRPLPQPQPQPQQSDGQHDLAE
ncbi:MAG: hypothetical protein QOI83_2820 [Streptomycetaceae bacterium]|nr:hypothetical protein [Streptomycetaceae bacterium]